MSKLANGSKHRWFTLGACAAILLCGCQGAPPSQPGSQATTSSPETFPSDPSGWQLVPTGNTTSQHGLFVLDAHTAFSVGDHGMIIETRDGSSRQLRPVDEDLYAVSFGSASEGWAVGDRGRLLHTVDGGESWMVSRLEADAPPESPRLRAVYAHGSFVCVAGLGGGAWVSVDSGAYWTAIGDGETDYHAVAFSDVSPQGGPGHGWIVGDHGTILSTSDSGFSWERQTPVGNNLYGAYFADAREGWIVGDGILLHTTNGRTFTAASMGRFVLNAVRLRGDLGWAVGDAGTILFTDDGGATWEPQQSPTFARLESVSMIDSHTGWLAGGDADGGGVLLHTTTGGW